MKISDIQKAGHEIINGAWVGDIPNLPGVRLHVTGAANPKARRIAADAYAALPKGKRNDPDELAKIEKKQIVDAYLLNWDGITDDDNDPLEYDRGRIEALLANPDFAAIFVEAVNYAVGKVGEIKAEADEADAKN